VTVVDSVVTNVAFEVRVPVMSAFDERNHRYPVIALPPFHGATQLRMRLVAIVDGFAERSVIGEGTVRGVLDAVDEYGPYPMTLLAAMRKKYRLPFVRPVATKGLTRSPLLNDVNVATLLLREYMRS
jgi:hypothetical protein